MIGTTSGCTYPAPTGKPDIPFAEFFAGSDALYPQTYWRAMQMTRNLAKMLRPIFTGVLPRN